MDVQNAKRNQWNSREDGYNISILTIVIAELCEFKDRSNQSWISEDACISPRRRATSFGEAAKGGWGHFSATQWKQSQNGTFKGAFKRNIWGSEANVP